MIVGRIALKQRSLHAILLIGNMLKISHELRRRVFEPRMLGERQYALARRAGLHPSLVSHILNGSKPIRHGDRRVERLAAAVGLPSDQAVEEVRG